MVKFSCVTIAMMVSVHCGSVSAADRAPSTKELILDVALKHGLLDHTTIYALASVNQYLQKRVCESKGIRKDLLMPIVKQHSDKIPSHYMDGRFSKPVYFHRYGSLCVYLTQGNVGNGGGFYGERDLCCNWAYVKDDKIEIVSGKKPLMVINGGVNINVGVVGDTDIPYVHNGLFCYGLGHGIKGPFFARDGTEFSFFYRPDYFHDKKGTQITLQLDGTETRVSCEDVEMCIAAYQPRTKQ